MNQFIKYSILVVVSYIFRLISTFVLTDLLNIWYLWSYSLTMFMLMLIGFYYHFYFTFKNVQDKKNKFLVYGISVLAFTLIDIYFVRILTDGFKIYYLISIIISNSILFLTKFIFYKKIVFIDYKEKGGNYFDKHGSKNPFIKYFMNQFHNVLFMLINKINIKTLLDVGCGEGYTTNLVQKEFPDVNITAIEFDEATVKKANEINSGLKVEKGDIYNINFKDNYFDAVLSSELLEHLEYPEKAIKECKRVSKKYCIFSVPNEPWWRIANILRLSYLPRLGNTPGHIQHWTKKSFRRLLKKHFKHVVIKNSILWNFALCWD